MADIELVIKIPEILYIKGFENIFSEEERRELIIAIGNGIPLTKGHGRIIDESQVTGTFIWDNGYIECYAPTIIEEDKAESEEKE